METDDAQTDDATGDRGESDDGGHNGVLVLGLLAAIVVVGSAVIYWHRHDETKADEPGGR